MMRCSVCSKARPLPPPPSPPPWPRPCQTPAGHLTPLPPGWMAHAPEPTPPSAPARIPRTAAASCSLSSSPRAPSSCVSSLVARVTDPDPSPALPGGPRQRTPSGPRAESLSRVQMRLSALRASKTNVVGVVWDRRPSPPARSRTSAESPRPDLRVVCLRSGWRAGGLAPVNTEFSC